MIPVCDFLRQALFYRSLGLRYQLQPPSGNFLNVIGNDVSNGMRLCLGLTVPAEPRTLRALQNLARGRFVLAKRTIIKIGRIA